MPDELSPLGQSANNLSSGAEASRRLGPGVTPAALPRTPSPAVSALAVAAQASHRPAGCTQCIRLAFFFDGTGNNLDADTPTDEHSNVARLFRAHPDSNPATQTYRYYIPGIGTYFREIGDPGGTTTGRGMGAYGQKRLDWAFKEMAAILQAAEGRAANPSNRITGVKVSVFGFSRGAALARAFCRDLQASCSGSRGQFQLKAGALGSSGVTLRGGYPIDVVFLGLFDTVASVGLPLSANNITLKRRNGANWRDFVTLGGSFGEAERDLQRLAFGAPGADPSPGAADGHGAWADNLRVVELVSSCLHLVAGHEMRNSFPLDSALAGNQYQDGTTEMIFPGVHSDVGGGYRRGEGGRSELLARVPLRLMLERAVGAGVPLRAMSQLVTEAQRRDFALDTAGRAAYEAMMDPWRSYMGPVNRGQPLGAGMLAHLAVYWRYRLSAAVHRTNPANAARRNGRGRPGRPRTLTPEQQTIANNEHAFAQSRAPLQTEAAQAQRAYNQAAAERNRIEMSLMNVRGRPGYSGQVQTLEQQLTAAKAAEDAAYHAWRSVQARVDGAANDSELIGQMDEYDAWLLEDAELLYRWREQQPRTRMRPHYAAIADAYAAVVINGQALAQTSAEYQFFSTYVHDSLSGFAQDNTRPSDPRVIYIGGDVKKDYAMNLAPGVGARSVAPV
jgi:uncharacterized protein (DUF2235 family)